MSFSKKVWLFRHGESEANAGQKTANPKAISLTFQGHLQAKEILQHFNSPPDLIVTSPYQRTKQTAQPLIDRYPETKCEEWPVYEYTYLAPDKYANTTLEERRPFAQEYWMRSDPGYVDGEGAESFSSFIARAEKTIRQLKDREDQFVVVFSHQQFISGIKWRMENRYVDITPESMRNFRTTLLRDYIPNVGKIEIDLKKY